jgi:hypothetical protein
VSSIQPDSSGGEVDGSEKISDGLVIAGGNCAELFEFAEEVLDQVARFIELLVEFARQGRDNGRLAGRRQWVEDLLVGVKSSVGDQQIGGHLRQQRVGANQIMGLSQCEQERQRLAERVDQSMGFCAQSAAAAANGLIVIFFDAPALC